MPLDDGYGVLAGTLHNYYCDRFFSDTEYYHCNLKVRAGARVFRCPVDLDSKKEADGMHWRVVELEPDAFQWLLHLREGWHPLDSEPGSGALDYYRSWELQPTGECMEASTECGNRDSIAQAALHALWKYGTGPAAFRDLEPLLKHSRKLFIFGEPFRRGRGVHNIHQNQGDPPQSRWHQENGTWQDGALVAQRYDKTIAAFLCKFKTQSFFPDSFCARFPEGEIIATEQRY
ncbi:MAG: YukJ family protein [Chlorobiaceae bacterium]